MVRELAVDDREMYFRYVRMTSDRKEFLLSLSAPLITKLLTNYKEPIPPEQRLSLTLRHLAAGESQISLKLQYHIRRQTFSKIIPEACKAIYQRWSRGHEARGQGKGHKKISRPRTDPLEAKAKDQRHRLKCSLKKNLQNFFSSDLKTKKVLKIFF